METNYRTANYRVYRATQKTNVHADMLIFVLNGKVIGNQLNPLNSLTQEWAEDGEDWGDFDPKNYLNCKMVG